MSRGILRGPRARSRGDREGTWTPPHGSQWNVPNPTIRLLRGLLPVLLLLLVVPGLAQALDAKVSAPLFSLARPGGATFVVAEVSSSARETARLIVELDEDQVHSQEIQLAPGAARRVPVYVQLPPSYRTVTVRVLDGRRKTVAEETFEDNRFASAGDVHLVAIGDEPLGLTLLQTATGEAVVGHDDCVEQRSVGAETIQPRELPTAWLGWDPIDVVVWRRPDPAALSPEQADALRTWVQLGGVLVVSLGDTWSNWTRSPLGALSGVSPEPREPTVEALEQVLGQGAPPEAAPLPHLHLGAPGGPLRLSRSQSLGAGRVVTLGYDLAAGELRELLDREQHWRDLLGLPEEGAPLARVELPWREDVSCDVDPERPWMINGLDEASQRQQQDDELGSSLGRFEKAAPLPLGLVTLVGILYLLLIGPGDYLLSKRLKRPMLTWVVFPALAIGFSVVTALAVYLGKRGDDELRCFEVVHVLDGQTLALGKGWCAFWAAGRDDLEIPVPRGQGRVAVAGISAPVEDPSRDGLALGVAQWSVNTWTSTWVDAWEGSVALTGSSQEPTLVNRSGQDLAEAWLLDGNVVRGYGAVADGAEAATGALEPWNGWESFAVRTFGELAATNEFDSGLRPPVAPRPLAGERLPPVDALPHPLLLARVDRFAPPTFEGAPATQGAALLVIPLLRPEESP